MYGKGVKGRKFNAEKRLSTRRDFLGTLTALGPLCGQQGLSKAGVGDDEVGCPSPL